MTAAALLLPLVPLYLLHPSLAYRYGTLVAVVLLMLTTKAATR